MRRILWWTFLAPLGFLALCAIVLFLFKEKTRRDLNAYKASLAAKGEKLELAALARQYPTETSESVRRFLAACEKVAAFYRNNRFPNPLPDKMNKDGRLAVASFSETARYRNLRDDPAKRLSWDDIAKQFEPCENLLRPVRDMALKENLEFHPDYQLNNKLSASYLDDFLFTTGLLYGDTLIQLKKGNPTQAVADIKSILRIEQILQRQLIPLCQISSCSHFKEAAELTWQAINSRTLDVSQLSDLQQAWSEVHPMANLQPCIRMERAFTVALFSKPDRLIGTFYGEGPYQIHTSKLKPFDQAKVLANIAAWRWVLLHRDEHRTLEAYQQLLAAIQESEDSKSTTHLRSEMERISGNTYDSALLMESWFSSTSAIAHRAIETETVVNLTITALALERFRLATGSYPTSLETLVPDYLSEVPADPYGDSPLRYQKTPERFSLYSIGSNLTDDTGGGSYRVSSPNKPFERGNDVIWPLPGKAEETDNKPKKRFVPRKATP